MKSVTDSRFALGVVFVIIALPLLLALREATMFVAANRSTGTITSSGERREYNLYISPSYDRKKPAPLVISLHGAGMWGASHEATSGWDRVADQHGFIVVYPTGVSGNGPHIWRENEGAGLAKDVTFIADLIDSLSASYQIDQRRVYVNGLSNGGGMSFALSCLLPERIAAVGMVGAAQLLPFSWCPSTRPVPMIDFHGTADLQIPYYGGSSWVAPTGFPNVRTWTTQWAARNRCQATPTDSAVARDVTRRAYGRCADDADVVLYTIQGGGHTWPGGGYLPAWLVGRTTRSIDASSVMWAFFEEHPSRGR